MAEFVKPAECRFQDVLTLPTPSKIIDVKHREEGKAIEDRSHIIIIHHHIHQGVDQFDPFRLQSYSCSRQRFFGLPIVLLPCDL